MDVSDAILGVLRDKFAWDGYRMQDARSRILHIANRVSPSRTIDAVKDDPDDNRILECAVEAGSECILTEDKDLLRMGAFDGIKIMRPAEFLRAS
jgi:predicted nucleic acid-binding protein